MPPVPRVEQHLSPFVLVLLEHADETAEAERVTCRQGPSVHAAIQAAVDLDHIPGQVRGPVGQQERNEIGDLVRLSDPA